MIQPYLVSPCSIADPDRAVLDVLRHVTVLVERVSGWNPATVTPVVMEVPPVSLKGTVIYERGTTLPTLTEFGATIHRNDIAHIHKQRIVSQALQVKHLPPNQLAEFHGIPERRKCLYCVCPSLLIRARCHR